MGRHDTRSDSPRVKGSSPVRVNFFAEVILLEYDSGRSDRMIYLRKNSIESKYGGNAARYSSFWVIHNFKNIGILAQLLMRINWMCLPMKSILTQFYIFHDVLSSLFSTTKATNMHSSRMRNARSLTISHSIRWGMSAKPPPPHWMQTPLQDADPRVQTPSGCKPPHSHQIQTPQGTTPPRTEWQTLVKT